MVYRADYPIKLEMKQDDIEWDAWFTDKMSITHLALLEDHLLDYSQRSADDACKNCMLWHCEKLKGYSIYEAPKFFDGDHESTYQKVGELAQAVQDSLGNLAQSEALDYAKKVRDLRYELVGYGIYDFAVAQEQDRHFEELEKYIKEAEMKRIPLTKMQEEAITDLRENYKAIVYREGESAHIAFGSKGANRVWVDMEIDGSLAGAWLAPPPKFELSQENTRAYLRYSEGKRIWELAQKMHNEGRELDEPATGKDITFSDFSPIDQAIWYVGSYSLAPEETMFGIKKRELAAIYAELYRDIVALGGYAAGRAEMANSMITKSELAVIEARLKSFRDEVKGLDTPDKWASYGEIVIKLWKEWDLPQAATPPEYYVLSLQWQVAPSRLTARRLKEALEEDLGVSVFPGIASQLLDKYAYFEMRQENPKTIQQLLQEQDIVEQAQKARPKDIIFWKTTIEKHYQPKEAFYPDSFRTRKVDAALVTLGCLKKHKWYPEKLECRPTQTILKTIVPRTDKYIKEAEEWAAVGVPTEYRETEVGIEPRELIEVV